MDAIKVVILDNYSSIICRISELKDEEGNGICFLITYPFLLESQVDENGNTNVRFSPFNLYIRDNEIRIPYNSVRSVCNAKSFIEEKYIEVVRPFDPVYFDRLEKMKQNEANETQEGDE